MIQKKSRRVSVINFEDIASEIHRIITGRKENKPAVQQPELGELSSNFEKEVTEVYYRNKGKETYRSL
jgi:hypothetical protein